MHFGTIDLGLVSFISAFLCRGQLLLITAPTQRLSRVPRHGRRGYLGAAHLGLKRSRIRRSRDRNSSVY